MGKRGSRFDTARHYFGECPECRSRRGSAFAAPVPSMELRVYRFLSVVFPERPGTLSA
jgi:hypothetical protein